MELREREQTKKTSQAKPLAPNLDLKDCIMAVAGSLAVAHELRQDLISVGCDADRILILQGDEGLDEADWASGSGGFLGKIKEILMRYSDIGEVIDRFEDAWNSGKTTITINTEGLNNTDDYALIIKRHGGTDIYKFGKMTFVQMEPTL